MKYHIKPNPADKVWSDYQKGVTRKRGSKDEGEQIKLDLLMILVKLKEQNERLAKANQAD